MRFKRSLILCIALLPPMACGGDRAGPPAASGEPGGTIVIATPGGIGSPMFPLYAQDPIARLGSDNLYDRLAEIGPDINAIGDRGFTPRLARSWEWAADSLSIAFAIDPRARWHDGQPVRASDVRFAFDLVKNPKSAAVAQPLISGVDSVSVRDSLTAVVWYKRRSPEQFYAFTYNVWPLPEHVLKGIAPEALMTSQAVANPVGSGRFRLARVEPGVRTELVADTTHYRGRPKLDRVIITTVPDPGAALTQFFAGDVDFLEIIPPDAQGRVDSAQTLRLIPYPALQHGYLGFSQRDPRRLAAPHPLFADSLVRRAISMAMDRQAMLRNIFGSRGVLSTGPAPKALGDTTITLPPFDRARAAALLDSAGWVAGADGIRAKNGRPLTFKLAVPTSSSPRMRYAVLIQDQLRASGVRVDLDQMDFNAFMDRGIRGLHDAALHGRGADPGPSDLQQSWATRGFPPNGQNWVRYSNPVVDAIADSILTTSDAARAQQLKRRALQTIVDDAPGVWLYDIPANAGAHRRLRTEGMRADAWWNGLADWWIPANERIERDRIGLRPAAATNP